MRKLPMIVLSCLLLAATSSVTAQAGTAQNQRIIRSYFGSSTTALCTAKRESGFYARATNYNTNGTIDRGLFQINSSWGGVTVEYYTPQHGVHIKINTDKLFNPRYNTRVAWAISHGGTDWRAWNGGCSYF